MNLVHRAFLQMFVPAEMRARAIWGWEWAGISLRWCCHQETVCGTTRKWVDDRFGCTPLKQPKHQSICCQSCAQLEAASRKDRKDDLQRGALLCWSHGDAVLHSACLSNLPALKTWFEVYSEYPALKSVTYASCINPFHSYFCSHWLAHLLNPITIYLKVDIFLKADVKRKWFMGSLCYRYIPLGTVFIIKVHTILIKSRLY